MTKSSRGNLTVADRQAQILELIDKNDSGVHARELRSRLPGVYPQLLQRDLKQLLDQGRITRASHGVYTASEPLRDTAGGLPLLSMPKYWARIGAAQPEKIGIARYIIEQFITRDGNYGLDASSTVTMIFQELAASPPAYSIKIVTNNLHGAILVPPSSQFDLTVAGGKVAFEYAATCGSITSSAARELDLAVIGFSRLNAAQGVWTLDRPQWGWKQSLCEARRVVFAGAVDKIGLAFEGDPIRRLDGLDYTVVASANAAGLSPEDLDRVEREREALGHRLVLVDERGCPATKLVTRR
jgi:DeoR/GlpR family transcriptional regulator of sugar metabolism